MDSKCPYRGLQPLSEEDTAFFAGREKEIRVIISNLHGSSLTILYGESGVGKTSVICAGVLPELAKDDRVVAILFREWQSPDFERKLRDQVLQSLLDAINRTRSRGDATEPPLSITQLHDAFCKGLALPSVEALYEMPFQRFVLECSAVFNGKIFFIFDQFEEYIYYHPLKGDGEAFDRALAGAVNDRQVPASFLLSLREDGLGKLDRLRPRIPDLLGNVVRLEHLNEGGARHAIERPLTNFSEDKPFTIQAEPELTDVLLQQVNADRLEMEDDPGSLDLRPGDGGARYKALALQAVLTQLWDADVVPNLRTQTLPSGAVQLRRSTLSRLAKNRLPSETEVRFLVRTYFDERLAQLTPREKEMAAEILRGLVRSGGHKRARTAEALAAETMLPLPQVETFLRKLASKPFSLLRKVEDARNAYYELHHDVMAFAIVDWCNRQRSLLQHKRLARRIVYFFLAIALISAGLLGLQRRKATMQNLAFQTESRALQKAIQSAAARLGMPPLDRSQPDAELGTLAAIDAIARCRTAKLFVSPRFAMVLQFATESVKNSEAKIDLANLREQLPGVESANGENILVKTENGIALIKKNSDPIALPVHGGITSMGFDVRGEEFGVTQEDGKVFVSATSKPEMKPSSSTSLAKHLKIPEGPLPEWFAAAPNNAAWKTSYDTVINKVMLNGISGLTRCYTGQERFAVGMPEHTFTDKVGKAYDLALAGKNDEAVQALQKTLNEVSLNFESLEVRQTLAANMFNRGQKESTREKRDELFARARHFDEEIQKNIKAFDQKDTIKSLIENATEQVKRGEDIEAINHFRRASEMDANLGPPEKLLQVAKQRLASLSMHEGNEFAKQGKTAEAISAYKKAIDYDPSLQYQMDPETEWKKFVPGAAGAPPQESP